MVLAGETLENPVDGRLALRTRDLIVPGLAPKKPQHRKKERDTLAVVEVLFNDDKKNAVGRVTNEGDTKTSKTKAVLNNEQ